MFRNYFKIAWRSMIQNKGLAFINIFGLAIGMAFAILIGLWIKYETSFDQLVYSKCTGYKSCIAEPGKEFKNGIM